MMIACPGFRSRPLLYFAETREAIPMKPTPVSHDLTCDLCGAEMVEQKCKIRCLNCGYTRDCSDP